MTATDLSMAHECRIPCVQQSLVQDVKHGRCIWRLYPSQQEWDSRPSCIQGNMGSRNLVNQEAQISI